MSEEVEQVAISIQGKKFKEWEEVEITLELDGIDTSAFVAPMEPDRVEFRNQFKPFSFADVEISTNNEPLFTGTMMDPSPATDERRRIVNVQCYSRPGVLEDCQLPADIYPIEWNGLTLKQIATECCGPFSIEVVMPLPLLVPDPPFTRVECDPEKGILDFLTDLAKQRNLIISSTPEGKLEFMRPLSAGTPVATIKEGEQPLGPVAAKFSPQGYYSEVTGLGTKKVGGKGGSQTEKNPRLSTTRRPHTFKVDAAEAATLGDAVNAKLGRMFANAVTYEFAVPTWRNQTGSLWAPGQFITLYAPGAMVYTPTLLMIRSVSLSQNKDTRQAKLSVVMPGTFSGEVPKVMPWE